MWALRWAAQFAHGFASQQRGAAPTCRSLTTNPSSAARRPFTRRGFAACDPPYTTSIALQRAILYLDTATTGEPLVCRELGGCHGHDDGYPYPPHSGRLGLSWQSDRLSIYHPSITSTPGCSLSPAGVRRQPAWDRCCSMHMHASYQGACLHTCAAHAHAHAHAHAVEPQLSQVNP